MSSCRGHQNGVKIGCWEHQYGVKFQSKKDFPTNPNANWTYGQNIENDDTPPLRYHEKYG